VLTLEVTLFHGLPNGSTLYLGLVQKPSTVVLLMLWLRAVGFVKSLLSWDTHRNDPPLCFVTMSVHPTCPTIRFIIKGPNTLTCPTILPSTLSSLGEVKVLHVPSSRLFADIFTKGLHCILFDEFQSSLNICPRLG
jgi:hypothetical protein